MSAQNTAAPRPVRFEGSLIDLCAVGLSRPCLDALCAGLAELPDPGVDRTYLRRILCEEIGRQFGHPLRPVLELVLNGVDAASPGGVVDVRVGNGHVDVVDGGVGMTLRGLLSRLLVPFATDKQPGRDIGRFGVGFFSVLGLAATDPSSFAVDVITSDGRASTSLRIRATGESVPESLVCALAHGVAAPGTAAGTYARAASATLDDDAVRAYLLEALHFLPPSRATILLDGSPLNDGQLIEGGAIFEDLADPGPPPVVGRFGLGGRPLAPSIGAATFHTGVRVEACLAVPELVLVDFPGAVELTEARDALKPGPALEAVAVAFHRRLVRVAERGGASRAARDRLAELAAQISALMLGGAGWQRAAPELSARLLGPDRFVVSPERAELLVAFLGQAIEPSLFVPESFWAEREWQHVMPGERELLERELDLGPIEPLGALAARRADLPALSWVIRHGVAMPGHTVRLARVRRTPSGIMPCLGLRGVALVRDDARLLSAPRTWVERYALSVAFGRACGKREPDFERDLIVHTELMEESGP